MRRCCGTCGHCGQVAPPDGVRFCDNPEADVHGWPVLPEHFEDCEHWTERKEDEAL